WFVSPFLLNGPLDFKRVSRQRGLSATGGIAWLVVRTMRQSHRQVIPPKHHGLRLPQLAAGCRILRRPRRRVWLRQDTPPLDTALHAVADPIKQLATGDPEPTGTLPRWHKRPEILPLRFPVCQSSVTSRRRGLRGCLSKAGCGLCTVLSRRFLRGHAGC